MWQTKYALAVPKNLGLGLNSGRAVKAISSLGVRSPCIQPKKNHTIAEDAFVFIDGHYLEL